MRHQFTLGFRRLRGGFLQPVAVGYGPPDALVPVSESKGGVTNGESIVSYYSSKIDSSEYTTMDDFTRSPVKESKATKAAFIPLLDVLQSEFLNFQRFIKYTSL